MEKQLAVSRPIELQGKVLPPVPQTEYDRKVDLITEYVEKFAAIDNRILTKQIYMAFIEALEDLELQRIRKGLQEALKDVEKFPWPGTIRGYCEDEI